METSPHYSRCRAPAGRSGPWVVEKVTIPEREYDPETDPRPDCFKLRPGVYTSLRRGSTQFMTDLYEEWWTQRSAILEARTRGGDVLVTGLGLGLVVESMLAADSPVRRVAIVERSDDVIRLVGPYLEHRYRDRVEIVHGDAFRWQPDAGRRFAVGWHDIWPDPHDRQAQAQAEQLESRFAPYCDWQGSWPREYLGALGADCERDAREEVRR
jgi:hypothetical protein